MEQEVKSVGLQPVKYGGVAIPTDEIHMGTVFFATGLGFGIVYEHSANGMVVKGMTANGDVRFKKLLTNIYRCCPVLSVTEQSEEHYGPSVANVVLFGELSLKLKLDDAGNVMDGIADFEYAEKMLQEYIEQFENEYRDYYKLRRALEQGYEKLKDTDGLTESERTFDPSKSEFLCLLRDGHNATWYYRQRTGKFFACAFETQDALEDSRPSSAECMLFRAIFETASIPTQRRKKALRVKALTDSQAEEALRRAVQQGRLSTYVYAKYFGEYADMKTQIAVRIPTALKKRMDWTGLTIESILEKGCDAYLKEVQDEFTNQNINTNEEV